MDTARSTRTAPVLVDARLARMRHPAAQGPATDDRTGGPLAKVLPLPLPPPTPDDTPASRTAGEEGSLLTEYGLLIVVAATIAGVLIQWAAGSQITGLFNALLRTARATVGA
jgi:hypothetical protein